MLSDSERLRFSFLKAEDRSISLVISQNSDVMNFIAGRALTIDEAEKRFEDQLLYNLKNPSLGFIKAVDKTSNIIIGYLKMSNMEPGYLEIGYALLPLYWSLGYASEMLKVMLNHTPTLKNFHTLVGVVDAGNMASINVLVKQGFTIRKDIKSNKVNVLQYIKPNK